MRLFPSFTTGLISPVSPSASPAPNPVEVKKIFLQKREEIAQKKPLEIPLYQKISFAMTLGAFLAHRRAPGLLQAVGYSLQALSGVSIALGCFWNPNRQTAASAASYALSFTPLRPLIQAVATYDLCTDGYRLGKDALKEWDGQNGWLIARNLFVYGVNAASSCYHLSHDLLKPMWPSEGQIPPEKILQAKDVLCKKDCPAEWTPKAVEQAFRTQAKTTHPDKGGDEKDFIRLQEARETLLGGLKEPASQGLLDTIEKSTASFFGALSAIDKHTRFPGAEAATHTCQHQHQDSHYFVEGVQHCLEKKACTLHPIEDTHSGVYRVENRQGTRVGIFKPSSERNLGPENRNEKFRAKEPSQDDLLFLELTDGFAAEKQAFAAALDFGSIACLPRGGILDVESDQFVDLRNEKSPKTQTKSGYLQEWVSDATPLVEHHPAHAQKNKGDNQNLMYQMKDNPMLDQVSLEEFQKIAILDFLLYNEDRHPGNILIKKVTSMWGGSSEYTMHPIDTDTILPGRVPPMWNGLFLHKRAKEALTSSNLQFIQKLNPDEVFEKAIGIGLPPLAARNAKALALVLKTFAAHFSLADMYAFISDPKGAISSRFLEILDRAERRSISDLSSKDSEQHKEYLDLRRKRWQGETLLARETDRINSYEQNEQRKIDLLKGEYFWKRFAQGLSRELEIAKAKQKRVITFGTCYVAGNPGRDSLSKFVSDQQQIFARLWDLDGKVVTDDALLKKQCGKGVDCVPYWNKVAILRKWLNEPSSGKEEWYILPDDDMPVTNMNFNPYEAVDLLRRGKDTSIIIARDVDDGWFRGGQERDLAVNTGLLIVRKDRKSRDFFEKLWERRNNPTNNPSSSVCPTLGTCKNQDVLHEQEGFARVLYESRNLVGTTVSIIKPRDTYQGKEIALNTFDRSGSFKRVDATWGNSPNCFSYEYDTYSGTHRVGDAMGQTAGVPIKGIDCNKNPYGPVESLRENILKKMVQNTVPVDSDPLDSRSINQKVEAKIGQEKIEMIKALPPEIKKVLDEYPAEASRLLNFQSFKSSFALPISKIEFILQNAHHIDSNARLGKIISSVDVIADLFNKGVQFFKILDFLTDGTLQSFSLLLGKAVSEEQKSLFLRTHSDVSQLLKHMPASQIIEMSKESVIRPGKSTVDKLSFILEDPDAFRLRHIVPLYELAFINADRLVNLVAFDTSIMRLVHAGVSFKSIVDLDYDLRKLILGTYIDEVLVLVRRGVSFKKIADLHPLKFKAQLKDLKGKV